MPSKSNDTNNFGEYVKKEQEKDPTVRIVKQEDLQPINDVECKHEFLHLDETEKDFDVLMCNNPKCNMGWMFPKDTYRPYFKDLKKIPKDKLNKEEKDG